MWSFVKKKTKKKLFSNFLLILRDQRLFSVTGSSFDATIDLFYHLTAEFWILKCQMSILALQAAMSAFPQRSGPQASDQNLVSPLTATAACKPSRMVKSTIVTLVTGFPSLQAAATSSSVGGSLLAMILRPARSKPPGCLQVLSVKVIFGSNPVESVDYF